MIKAHDFDLYFSKYKSKKGRECLGGYLTYCGYPVKKLNYTKCSNDKGEWYSTKDDETDEWVSLSIFENKDGSKNLSNLFFKFNGLKFPISGYMGENSGIKLSYNDYPVENNTKDWDFVLENPAVTYTQDLLESIKEADEDFKWFDKFNKDNFDGKIKPRAPEIIEEDVDLDF